MSVLKHFEQPKEILFMKEKDVIFDGGHRKLSLHVNSIDVSWDPKFTQCKIRAVLSLKYSGASWVFSLSTSYHTLMFQLKLSYHIMYIYGIS